MAISYVGGKTAGFLGATTGDTTVALNSGLTGGSDAGVSANDLVIVAINYASGGTPATPSIATSGYILIGTANGTDNNNTRLSLYYKFMPATPDTQVLIGPTGNIEDGGAYAIHVWRGISLTQPFNGTATAGSAGAGSSRVNPPSITPTTTGAVVVAAGGAAGNSLTTAWTIASVNNFIQSSIVETADSRVGLMSVNWTSGAVDIAASTTGQNAGNESWASVVCVLRDTGQEKFGLPIEARINNVFQHLLMR